MERYGLVFSGGGGKGAYQIGVWEALCEHGIAEKISCVSGTSVGALNASLFAQGNLQRAKKIWQEISPDQILQIRSKNELDEFLSNVKAKEFWQERGVETLTKGLPVLGAAALGIVAAPMCNPYLSVSAMMRLPALLPAVSPPVLQIQVWKAICSYMGKQIMNGFFSVDGLTNLLTKAVDVEKLRASEITCIATCCSFPTFQTERFHVSGEKAVRTEDVSTVLLASSALPIIFPVEKIGKNQYYDGGIRENTPIQPIYDYFKTRAEDRKCTAIVVYLDRKSKPTAKKFPGMRILNIIPSGDLGNVIEGTLDFTQEGVTRRLQMGYEDASAALRRMEQETTNTWVQYAAVSKEDDNGFLASAIKNRQETAAKQTGISDIVVRDERERSGGFGLKVLFVTADGKKQNCLRVRVKILEAPIHIGDLCALAGNENTLKILKIGYGDTAYQKKEQNKIVEIMLSGNVKKYELEGRSLFQIERQ
ncbi:MAG: patatin-like phospholipase family protein [Alphaproteobacteria bacterium]|nr:patatin-like phospholipase family protein [Alphaproteobacteria bacterium]